MIDISDKVTSGAWRLEDGGEGVAFLVLDVPGEKVNILTEPVLRDLAVVLDALEEESSLKALVVIGGKEETGTFIAGASVHEIRGVESAEEAAEKARLGQAVLGKLSSLHAVTLAAIHGNCLGGGTELALACDLRVATHSPKTRIGLPEVQLGIIPGFGGTQRLPRLVGITRALPMILTGKPQEAQKAAKIGLVDRLVYPGRLREDAAAFAKEAVEKGGKRFRPRRPRRPLVARILEALPPGRALIRRTARKDILRRVGEHYPAPLRALDAVIDGYGRTLDSGLKLEARLVGELVASPVAKNLIDLFLAGEKARRGDTEEASVEEEAVSCVADGDRIGLLGAGVMGGGLAALIARKGFRVRMKDISHDAIQTGLRNVAKLYGQRVKRRRMTAFERDNFMAAITTTVDYSGFERVRFVIEAVVENLDVKKQVLAEIEERTPEDAVLASNTSALSITAMQEALRRPERFVGLHFFNPVDRMLLVEIVRGERTGDEAVASAEALARKLGKIPVRVGDGPGFLVNRLLAPYLNEAVRLFEEGYEPLGIDRVIRRFGMPLGPFELLDEVGLDVAAKVGKVLHEAFGERAEPSNLMERFVGRSEVLGKKSGKGFYLYPGGKRGKINREMYEIAGDARREARSDDPDLWVKRLIYPIINEAGRALEERIVERPSLVDLAMVMGTGFAPFRGGPLRHADAVGTRQVADALKNLQEARFRSSALLERLAESGEGFYSLEEDRERVGAGSPGAVHSTDS